jgi:hypothetical protein
LAEPTLLFVADLVDPDDPEGRTYRQVNTEKQHAIPIGALVELEGGARLFVVHHGRDCDMTPLYWLSTDQDDTEPRRPGFLNHGWIGGYPEESLRVIV